MKKTKKLVAILSATTMALASLTAVSISASAANDTIQPRGAYHVYGDANNDGTISIADVVCVLNAIKNGYFGQGQCPQAADVNGDGYITNDDATMIQNYVTSNGGKVGRCGQTFYLN